MTVHAKLVDDKLAKIENNKNDNCKFAFIVKLNLQTNDT
jgi:hypothetical protein